MRAIWLPLAVAILAASGCNQATPPDAAATPTARLDDDSLRQLLDEVIDYNGSHRQLTVRDHAAWQVMHGVVAYQRDFMIDVNGSLVPAVDYLLSGGAMKGWTLEAILDAKGHPVGVRPMLESGSKTGEGHTDQWLACLSECHIQPDDKLMVHDTKCTFGDLIRQAEQDVPRNLLREYSWTLIGLTTYRPTDYHWVASDGREWSIEQLVGIEAEQGTGGAACGGTHRMSALAIALNRHLAQHGKLEDAWKQADDKIQWSIARTKEYQNPDGSFSINYFEAPGVSPDLTQNLAATGHIFEFLSMALNDEQLREPWVQRSAVYMCRLLQKTRNVSLECGALYHAIHGLATYRRRLYGPRNQATASQQRTIAPHLSQSASHL